MALVATAAKAVKYDSFTPGELWYDTKGEVINAHGGGMLYHDGTYYWFGEHKIAGSRGNSAQVGVHCYSSQDLYKWKDEGIALPVSDDPKSDIARGCILERPKVIYNAKTGKFVMWFHLELKGEKYASALSGIAVADKPAGPYTYLHSVRSNPGVWPMDFTPPANYSDPDKLDSIPKHDRALVRDFEKGQMQRDMTLFVDDDGKAYHIYASEENGTTQIAELTDDYLGHSGRYTRAFIGRYMEGAAVFKRDGLYYFMGSNCTGWAPNAARSAVAPSIWGPWKELGNPAVDGTDGPGFKCGPGSGIGGGPKTTYDSQSTYILPVEGLKDAFIYMGDRWRPKDPIDGRYIWLPVEFKDGRFLVRWEDKWDLSWFK